MTDENNFFSKPQQNMDDQNQQPDVNEQGQESEEEMFTIGDKEYSPDELEELVKLGEIGREAEEKYNTKIDRVWPNFNEVRDENEKLRQRVEEFEKSTQAAIDQKVQQGQPLSPEEERDLVIKQAKQFGLMTKEDVSEAYRELREQERQEEQANQMINDMTSFLDSQAQEGKPKTSVHNLATFMDENGITNHEAAYKLMFEDELDSWKLKNINQNRPEGLYTSESNSAGGKQPEPQRVTSENLKSAIHDVVTRGV